MLQLYDSNANLIFDSDIQKFTVFTPKNNTIILPQLDYYNPPTYTAGTPSTPTTPYMGSRSYFLKVNELPSDLKTGVNCFAYITVKYDYALGNLKDRLFVNIDNQTCTFSFADLDLTFYTFVGRATRGIKEFLQITLTYYRYA